ncbi:MAG: hypothetical protein LBD98_05365 [Endomicrobium sp.]|jgi:hypothetical protein|nr:hypothetical protein [Endomicrobium sp.]
MSAVVRTVSEIGLALLFLDFGFRALLGRNFIRLRQADPALLEHGATQ